jgi:hypothetical protein
VTVDVVVGRLAVLDRFNPHERGFLVVLLLDGGVANSQSGIGQTPHRRRRSKEEFSSRT